MARKASLEDFLAAAVEAAKIAGEIIRTGFYETKQVEHKGEVDLVTETDKKCEELIFNFLKLQYPDHKFIGEETTAACGATELTDEPTWIADPVDGTTNFVHGQVYIMFTSFTIMDPPKHPHKHEAFYSGFLLYVYLLDSPSNEFQQLVLSTIQLRMSFLLLFVARVLFSTESPSKVGTKRDKATINATTDTINSLLFKVRSIRMSGSCALDLCAVACGRIDLFYLQGFGPWDVAAGAVIVNEAGGLVYDPLGKDFDLTSQKIAASNPFVEALQQSEFSSCCGHVMDNYFSQVLWMPHCSAGRLNCDQGEWKIHGG